MDVCSSVRRCSDGSSSRALPPAGSVHSIPPRNAGANHRAGYERHQSGKPRRSPLRRLGLTLAPFQATVQLNNHFYKSSQCVPALFEIASTSPNAAVSHSPRYTALPRRWRRRELGCSQVGRKFCQRPRRRLAKRDTAAAMRHLARWSCEGDCLAGSAALTRYCRSFT